MSERTLSPSTPIEQHERRVLAWTVSWILSVGRQKGSKGKIELNATLLVNTRRSPDSSKTFVLYRNQMLRLLAFPKPPFDQLAIELPCLMGFRSKEVTTWRAEYIDFQNMNAKVLDAKKHELFSLPLNLYVAKHSEEVLNGRSSGVVLRSRSNRNRGEQLTPFAVWHIWNKWIKKAKLWNADEISPVAGRRYFAKEFLEQQKGAESENVTLMHLQIFMRHTHFETTMIYARGLVFDKDLRKSYDRFQFGIQKSLEKMQTQMKVPVLQEPKQ